MTQTQSDRSFRLAFFSTVKDAEDAIHGLLSAGYSKDQLAVICPQKFQGQLDPEVRRAESPGAHVAEAIVEGGAIGAMIGGIGLAGLSIVTGGVAMLAIPVVMCGGALAGGFSGLILSDGYGKEIGKYHDEAIRLGRIVVGVEVQVEETDEQLAQIEHILAAAGGTSLADMQET